MDWEAFTAAAEEERTDEEVLAGIVAIFEEGGKDLDALSAAITAALELGLTEAYVPPVAKALMAAGAKGLGYTKAELTKRITRELRDTYGEPGEASEPEIDHAAREAEAAEASKDLRADPNLLDAGVDLVHRLGVVGEDPAIKAVLLTSVSRLTMKPNNLLLQGESSGGKSTVLLTAIRLSPPEKVKVLTTFSPKSLVYADFDYRHAMIVLLEAAPLSTRRGESTEQSHMLRILLSEGRIIHETVLIGEDGPYLERIEKEGPTGLLSCNVVDHLDAELLTRLIVVGIDGGPEQTKEVLTSLADRAAGAKEADLDAEIETWREMFRWLAYQSTRVIIPFAPTIQDLLEIAQTRTRRDFTQLLSMISASALLHRSTREVEAAGRVIATLDDYRHAREALGPGIDQSSDRKPPTDVARMIDLLARMMEEDAPAARGGKKFATRPGIGHTLPVSVRELATKLHASKSAVHRWVKIASDEGLLINHNEGSRRPHKLELLVAPPGTSSEDVLPSVERVEEALSKKSVEGPPSPKRGTAGTAGQVAEK